MTTVNRSSVSFFLKAMYDAHFHFKLGFILLYFRKGGQDFKRALPSPKLPAVRGAPQGREHPGSGTVAPSTEKLQMYRHCSQADF